MFINDFENAIRASLQLPGLVLKMKPQWGAAASGFRGEIRRSLANDLRSAHWPEPSAELESQLAAIEDLERRPDFRFAKISISHCRALGGYAFLPGERLIGLDIEEVRRITREACERISTPEEIPEEFYLLWSAKEAAYKALGLAGEAISSVKIGGWRALSNGFFAFEAMSESGGRATGVALKTEDGLTLALAHS